jgi:hypothetical protein
VRRTQVVVFAVLVAATFAAFFVAQRLKAAPTVVQQLSYDPVFSPNHDGRKDRAHVTFKLKQADDVTVEIVDAAGEPVKTLLDRHLGAYAPIKPSLAWDGTNADGKPVPDGRYRVRITLRHLGRALIGQRSILKDTTPPKPKILSIGPEKSYGPELLPEPGGKPAQVHFGPALQFGPAAAKPTAFVHVFRTGPGAPHEVRTATLAKGQREWDWDGTNDAGKRVSPGTYLVVLEWRDFAGNIGTSVPLDRRGLPILSHGNLPGRGGVTVRYVGARPPVTAVKARDRMEIDVDARSKHYKWDVRRIGESATRSRSSRAKTTSKVIFGAPGGASGVYVFTARTRDHATRVVFPVQARRPVAGTAAKPHGVLVVLPYVTWQGRNPADDDGDGAPDTLDRGGPARFFRIMAGDGLPQGFTEQEGPLLRWLDRSGKTYDITTDLALALGKGPQLTGHHGVLIPGDARWLPAKVRTGLRTFAARGGTVVSTGTDSLKRTVALDAKGRLTHPATPRATDLFGAKLRPVVTKPTDLQIFTDDQRLDLFHGADGLFAQVPAWEETTGVGQEANLLSNAVTLTPQGKSVIVAAQFGKGLVIRPGFPSFSQRVAANTDPATSALMARMWTLLSR